LKDEIEKKKSIKKRKCKFESTELTCQTRGPGHKTGIRSKLKKYEVQFLIILMINDEIEVEKKTIIIMNNVMRGGV